MPLFLILLDPARATPGLPNMHSSAPLALLNKASNFSEGRRQTFDELINSRQIFEIHGAFTCHKTIVRGVNYTRYCFELTDARVIESPQSTCVVHDCWCKGAAVEKFGNYLAINKQSRPSLSQLEGACLLQRHPLNHQPHLIHLIEQHATLEKRVEYKFEKQLRSPGEHLPLQECIMFPRCLGVCSRKVRRRRVVLLLRAVRLLQP